MPYLSDKIKLPRTLDRRIKVFEDMKEAIIEAYKRERSFRAVGRIFGLDKKTIKHIIDPQSRQEQYQEYKLSKHSAKYYDKIKHRKYTKNHRHYKHELFKNGLIQA